MSTDRLAELIRRKHEVLGQLLALGRRQAELIAADDWTTLMRVLSAKGRLVGAIRDIESNLEPYRHDDPHRRGWSSAAVRDECRRLADECGGLLAAIVACEKASETDLIQRRDAAARRLEGAHTAAFARGAYGDFARSTSVGLDVTSESV